MQSAKQLGEQRRDGVVLGGLRGAEKKGGQCNGVHGERQLCVKRRGEANRVLLGGSGDGVGCGGECGGGGGGRKGVLGDAGEKGRDKSGDGRCEHLGGEEAVGRGLVEEMGREDGEDGAMSNNIRAWRRGHKQGVFLREALEEEGVEGLVGLWQRVLRRGDEELA